MKNLKLLILLFCTSIGVLKAQQDVHFSQFFSSPLTINPANAGIFNGDFRGILNYRNQWSSVTTPYTTMAASFDMPILKKMKGGMFGIGLNFFKDDAGDSKLSTLKYNLALAYHLDISGEKNQFLSIGFQGGMIQRTINYGNLTWDNQWNGVTFNQKVFSADNLGGSTVNALDLSTGLHWYYSPTNFTRYFAGISLYHLNSPNVSFNGADSKLLKKFIIHGGAEIGSKSSASSTTGSNFAFLPNFIFVKQGPNQYFDFGGEAKFRLQQNSKFTNFRNEMSFSIGPYLRFGDAAYVVARFNWMGMTLAASYDFNLSNLTVASNGNGGFEIMLGYKADFGENSERGHSVRFN